MTDLNQEIEKLIQQHSLAVENLTREQLAEALRQAFLAGDFVRHIQQSTGAQQVTYIPFYDVQRLRLKLSRMEMERDRYHKALRLIIGLGEITPTDLGQAKYLAKEALAFLCKTQGGPPGHFFEDNEKPCACGEFKNFEEARKFYGTT